MSGAATILFLKKFKKLGLLFGLLFTVSFLAYSQQIEVSPEFKLEKLQKEYDAVSNDRQNLLTQIKKLLADQGQVESYKREIKKLENYIDQLKDDKSSVVGKTKGLDEEIADLHKKNLQKLQEIEELKKYIENMEIEYRIVNETKKSLENVNKKNSELERLIEDLKADAKKYQDKFIELKASSEVYRRQLEQVDKENRKLIADKKKLRMDLDKLPKKFAQIARENKLLIKQTALTHYNLGVFYTENKEYRRASAEFKKSLELNADDAYAHFNLGYLYAEYLVDRKNAIDQFRHYLRLTDKDDQDTDWAKRYILTWQAWEEEPALK